ncbi:MAG TPA: type II toxin-antitoxin system Phd/YefM family antitoxin [Alphaproteobacteria bacterium]
MAKPLRDETVIGVTAFKAKCLALIDEVARGKTRRVVLTKHGHPVAVLGPAEGKRVELWGAMRGSVRMAPGTDLTQPTGEVWDANA